VTNRGWFILFLGAALVGIGLLALNFPVFLGAYDQWGWQVKCGTGYRADLMQAEIARQASPHTNFVDQCQAALVWRRVWSIPIAVVGWLILSGVAIALWRHASPATESAGALT
jgi:hypothetical protein